MSKFDAGRKSTSGANISTGGWDELEPSSRSAEGRALDALVAEAKEHLDVRAAPSQSTEPPSPAKRDVLADLDWSRLESRVMTAIETEEKPALLRDVERSRRSRSRDVALRAGAVVLAAAAAVALFVRNDRHAALREAALDDRPSSSGERASASSLRTTEGAGEVRIGGNVASPGYALHAGDAIDVDGARAVFERPRKVTWLIEQDSAQGEVARGPVARARVTSAGEPLVLGLDHGAIEAQVVPVASGEAFAVDIATERSVVRVAVHGTHLRVARSGNRVVVDLTEGVVSIGVPPRTGVTHGTIVTAPAHVELDATDLATLRIDHAPSSVRAPVPLGGQEIALGAGRPESSSSPEQPEPAPPAPRSIVAKGPATRPDGTAPGAKASSAGLRAREAIAEAVRDCAALGGRARGADDVHVTVNSTLRLRVSAAGAVESAQFTPPLSPDIQSCAAKAIYKTKLDETGLVTIPIEFSY